MGGLSVANIGWFVFLLVTQIIAIALLPRTAGFTDPFWSLACGLTYAVTTWTLAYMIHSGVPMGLLVPILAALIPLATIFIGVTFYRESASLLKIALLCGACGLIGAASSLR